MRFTTWWGAFEVFAIGVVVGGVALAEDDEARGLTAAQAAQYAATVMDLIPREGSTGEYLTGFGPFSVIVVVKGSDEYVTKSQVKTRLKWRRG